MNTITLIHSGITPVQWQFSSLSKYTTFKSKGTLKIDIQ